MRILDVKPPEGLTVEALREIADRQVLADLTLKVVTPMFGGGVKPGEVDTDHPIRASAIRGHLRFWWRACNAAGFDSLEKMRDEERLLWGTAASEDDPAEGPGVIGLEVQLLAEGEPFTPKPDTSFATWPFTQQGVRKGQDQVRFRLRLTLGRHESLVIQRENRPDVTVPDRAKCQRAVQQALWAWIVFGGVGARTRRGCGSLLCEADAAVQVLNDSLYRPPADPAGLQEWLTVGLTHVLPTPAQRVSSAPACVSLFGTRLLLGRREDQTYGAWRGALCEYKEFLQGEKKGRHPRPDPRRNARYPDNVPGQSWWPEARAARGLLDADRTSHDYEKAPARTACGKDFPRADLGLPRKVKVEQHAGGEAVIQGSETGRQRMASPIVTKAIALSSTKAFPVVLVLNSPHVWGLGLEVVELVWEYKRASIPLTIQPMTTSGPAWPFKNKPPERWSSGHDSARDAFVTYLTVDQGWQVVV